MNAATVPTISSPLSIHQPDAKPAPSPARTSRPRFTNSPPSAPKPDAAPTQSGGLLGGLRMKLLLPTVLLLIAALGAVGFVVKSESGSLETSQLLTLTTVARSIQDRIDRCLFERYGDVQAFSLNPIARRDLHTLDAAGKADILRLLNDYAAAYGCYPISLIVDPAGKVMAINDRSPEGKPLAGAAAYIGQDLSSTAWFQQVKAGNFTTYRGTGALTGTYVDEPAQDPMITALYGASAPTWTMSFSAPIKTTDGKDVVGYWHNVFNPQMIDQILIDEYAQLKERGLGSTEINVTRRDGALVMDFDPTETGQVAMRTTDLFKTNLLTMGDEFATIAQKSTTDNGVANAMSARMKVRQPGGFARSIPTLGYAGSGFTTFVRAEPKELFRTTDHLQRMVVIVTIAAIVVGIAIIVFVATRMTRMIDRIKDGIAAIGQGDLTHEVDVRSRDEIAAMANDCNSLRESLRGTFGMDRVDWKVLGAQRAEVDRLKSVVENSPINIMVTDTDHTIVYINPASTKTLGMLEKYLPVKVAQVVGSSVDIFHKDPSHQRRLLSDPKNLPVQATFALGNEHLSLTASALYDSEGRHMGNMVSWEVVTEKLAAEKREKEITASLKATLEKVDQNAQTIAAAAEELSATARTMSANSEETSAQSNNAAAAAEQVSKNVTTVATSAEEMSASVREIAKSAAEAARVGTAAVKIASDTNANVAKLGESSNEIGKVIKVITSIAQQTNLLALNATIEAARAGEAGKGFAVVANEVKELAKQTAAATEDISGKIEAIQTDTTGAVTAIAEITKVITRINDIQNTIASAVEEQSATTNEIARNAAEAAKGSNEITKNISSVSQAAHSTSEGAANTLTAAGELAQLSTGLKRIVDAAHQK